VTAVTDISCLFYRSSLVAESKIAEVITFRAE